MTENLWPQEQWDSRYVDYQFKIAPETDPIRKWLESRLRGKSGSCLEFGCFPGHFLAVLGQMGFELNGVDLTPRVDRDLPEWLRKRGFRVGQIVRGDAFERHFDRRFDVVCSFGFIEHFTNWREVLARHAELVSPGGFLAVTTPNFRGFAQNVLHRCLDAENLARHNIHAMNPSDWAAEAARLGLEVIEYGGLGSFDFWAEPQQRSLAQRAALKLVFKSRSLLGRLSPPGPLLYAPYCRLLARRGAD